jgi:N-carbamoylputrescine amidase
MNTLKAALIQQKHTDDAAANRRRSADAIRQAHAAGAGLVVLSELHVTRYFCQSENLAAFDLAEPIPGPSTNAFAALARELGIVLVGSFFERRAPGLYHNTAVVFERDGSIAGRYRKMHIPDDPAYYEKFYFTPGDLGFTPIPTSVGRLGVLVCWDQWYPEAARLMALAGADLLIYPTAIGWEPSDAEAEKQRQLDAWVTIQRSHAVANGIPVLSVNRVGYEPAPQGEGGIQFWGHSFAVGAQGEFLAQASPEAEAVVSVELDGRRGETVRRIWPFLRDRRIDAYGDMTKRFRDGDAEAADGGR